MGGYTNLETGKNDIKFYTHIPRNDLSKKVIICSPISYF